MFPLGRTLTISLACAFALASIDVITTDRSGSVFKLEDDGPPFYVAKAPVQTLYPADVSSPPPQGLTPVTSIRVQYSPITQSFIESQLSQYAQVDDVWNEHFAKSLVISYDGPVTAFFDNKTIEWLEDQNFANLIICNYTQPPVFKRASTNVVQMTSKGPLTGPYLVSSESSSSFTAHNIYRLHKDQYDAFLFGVLPDLDGDGGWIQTNITIPSDPSGSQYIPIPSRTSFFAPSASFLPLSGMRFGLKDIYDAKGLPTGAGSLLYSQTHPSADATAPSVTKLLSLGATLVGKTRTSQFAHGAQPWEFADVPYSWNPRGDGHLTASASSSGSACAIAGYDWLDFTVGSDTRGSVRKPAALVGAYGIRPTRGSIGLEGVVPLSEEMDTAGFFTRDPTLFREISRLWYSGSPVAVKRQTIRMPPRLHYPTDHFPVANPEAQALYDSFTKSLESLFRIRKTPIDFTEALLPHMPNSSFADFLRASNTLAQYRSWNTVGKPLVEAHQKLTGADPVFDPVPQRMFAVARDLTEEDFERSVTAKRHFADAIAEDLFKLDKKSCSDSLFIYDAGTGGVPSYRFEELNVLPGATQFMLSTPPAEGEPSRGMADFFNFVASMGDLPEISVPLGEVSYFSHVTSQWEMIPVGVQIVAGRGCDGVLLELVGKLAAKGLLRATEVGKRGF